MTANVGLSHPQIDVDARDRAVKESIKAGQYQPLPLPEPLEAMETISVIWPGPPNNRLQVFIGLPIGLDLPRGRTAGSCKWFLFSPSTWAVW